MSENNSRQDPIPTNEFLIAQVAKIKAELEELKNLKDKTFKSSSPKRKPARKTTRKTAAKRKPARKTTRKTAAKRKPTRKTVRRRK